MNITIMKTEKSLNPLNGYIVLSALLILCVGIIVLFINGYKLLPGLLMLAWIFVACGLVIVTPDNITPNVPVISLTNVPGVSLTNEPGVSPTNVPQ